MNKGLKKVESLQYSFLLLNLRALARGSCATITHRLLAGGGFVFGIVN